MNLRSANVSFHFNMSLRRALRNRIFCEGFYFVFYVLSLQKKKADDPPQKQSTGVEKSKKQPSKKTEKAAKVVTAVEPKAKAVKETKKPAAKATKKMAKSKPDIEPVEPVDEHVVEIPQAPKAVAKKPTTVKLQQITNSVHSNPEPMDGEIIELPEISQIAINGNGVHTGDTSHQVVPIASTVPAARSVVHFNDTAIHHPIPIVPQPAPAVAAEPAVLRPVQIAMPKKKSPTTVRATFDEYANGISLFSSIGIVASLLLET